MFIPYLSLNLNKKIPQIQLALLHTLNYIQKNWQWGSFENETIWLKKWFPKICLRTSLCLFGFIFSKYLVRILYVVVICIPIRLHQSNQPHSLTCITFKICKYQVLYVIPCCNLQNMSMYVQWFVLYVFIDLRWKVIMSRKLRFCNNIQWVHSKSKDCKLKN